HEGHRQRSARGRRRGGSLRLRRRMTGAWDALEQAVAVDAAEIEPLEVNVADVATADRVRARAGLERALEVGCVEVADRPIDEMAAPHRAFAVDGDRRFAREAALPEAFVLDGVRTKVRVDRFEAADLLLAQPLESLRRVDPQVDRRIERLAKS